MPETTDARLSADRQRWAAAPARVAAWLLLIWAGFEMSNYVDGSSTTPGGLLAGLLTLLAWGVMVVPLIAAVATKWVSRWWLVTHCLVGSASLVLIVYAAMFEKVGSSDLG